MDSQLVAYEEPIINNLEINILRNGAQIITTKDQQIKDERSKISKINKRIKSLKEERHIAESKIIPIMNKGNLEELNISQGTIKYIEHIKKTPLNAKQIKIILNKFFLDDKIKDLLDMENDYDGIELAQVRTQYIIDFLNSNSKKKTVTLLEGKYNV